MEIKQSQLLFKSAQNNCGQSPNNQTHEPQESGPAEVLSLHIPRLPSAHFPTVMKELNEVFKGCHTSMNGY